METPRNQTDYNINSQFDRESKQMEISETLKDKEYYHITSLKELSSFKDWASSKISDGRWQWYGFYMRTNKQDSNNHIAYMNQKELIDAENPAVRISFKVSPNACEPDYQYLLWESKLNSFLTENLDIIKKIPYWWEYKMADFTWESHNIMFDKTISTSWTLKLYVDWYGTTYLNDKNVVNGAVVTAIMHYFRDNYPEKYISFINSVESPAVRYLWTRNIFPSKVEILNNGIWKEIDVETYFNTEKIKYINNSWEECNIIFDDDVVL